MDVVVVIPASWDLRWRPRTASKIWPPTPAEANARLRRIDQLHPPRPSSRRRSSIASASTSTDRCSRLSISSATRATSASDGWFTSRMTGAKNLLEPRQGADATLRRSWRARPGREDQLLCHSMGGILARVSLERPRATVPGWAAAIDLCASWRPRTRARPSPSRGRRRRRGHVGPVSGATATAGRTAGLSGRLPAVHALDPAPIGASTPRSPSRASASSTRAGPALRLSTR